MSREVMKQALEAFEWNYNTDLDNIPACEQWAKMLKKNIAALRERLAEPGTWREVTNDQLIEEVRNRGYEIRDAKITALRQARSLTDELMDCVDRLGSEADTVDPRVWQHLLVYAPKQEPVAWANSSDLQNFDMKVRTGPDLNHTVPLYTSPPKREWVGLTDEEVVGIGNASGLKAKPTSTGIIIHPDGIKNFFQAIEAKLREKNHG